MKLAVTTGLAGALGDNLVIVVLRRRQLVDGKRFAMSLKV